MRIPEKNHELGYTHSHLMKFFSENNLDFTEFTKWGDGQTVAFDREIIYYTYDVQRYFDKYINRTTNFEIFD